MKTSIFVLSSLLISAGCAVSSFLASSVTQDWIVGAFSAAFIGLFTAVVVPYVTATRKAASEAKAEAKQALAEAYEAKQESLECRVWRQINEPLIQSLMMASLKAVVTVAKGEHGLAIVSVNEAAAKMFGRTIDEMIAADLSELVAPDDRVAHQQKMGDFFESDRPAVAINEGHAINKQGEEFLVDVTVQRVKYHGQPALMAEIKKIAATT